MSVLRLQRALSSLLFTLCIVFVSSAGPADALTIRFDAQDLPEAIGAPDRWQLTYDFAPDEWANVAGAAGFAVAFDVGTTAGLALAPEGPGADWDAIVLQPDPLLPAAGFYDALALVSTPSLAGPFAVTFDWLGEGAPGSQTFTIYDASFAPIVVGETVPEPGTAALLAVGLLCLARRSRNERGAR